MKKNFVIFLFTLFFSILLSACSKTANIQEAKDYVSDKIALEEKIDLLEAQKKNFDLPSWAVNLNITTPVSMVLNEDLSYKTSQEVEWFNSMRFVYNGEYDIAMQQAEKIAKIAWIEISEEFKMAQDIVKQMWDKPSNQIQDLLWDLKGIVYTNYSLTKKTQVDNIVSISVEEDWTLEIVVTDQKNMENVVSKKIG